MKHIIHLLIVFTFSASLHAQYGDCGTNADACTNPSFSVTPSGFGLVEEFTTMDNISNPQTNPNASPGNSGCLLSGELNSTWLQVTVSSSGTLEFSMGTPAAGGFGDCYDWIMWPYDATACADIASNSLPPVACNWNGACGGITGMANPGNLPAGADPSDFENGIAVNAGDQFMICFSNFSSATTNVPLDFFGTATVTCGAVTNPVICFGETAAIAALDGVTYNWDTSIPGFISTNAAGDTAFVNPTVTTDYPVDIVMGNGSVQSEIATVTVLAQITPTVTVVTETCIGDNNGSLSFTATNGVAPITYSLTGAGTGNNTNGTFSNLVPGNYTIDIVDANGCTGTLAVTLDPGPPCCGMILTTTQTDNDCFNNCIGTATVDTTGTSGPAPIQWYDANGIAIPGANGLSTSNLCAGDYTVEVADALCTLTETFTITAPTELTISDISENLACFQDNSGQISLTASGGTAPYQYSIDNGITYGANPTFSNLTADSYDLMVSDANNCEKNIQIILTEPDPLQETIVVQDNTCNELNAPCDGEITVSMNGGTSPFTFVWDNGLSATNNPTGVCPNAYTANITDANGCNIVAAGIIVNEPAAVSINNLTTTSPLCYSDCDGTILIDHTNGATFSVDNGLTFELSNDFQSLCSGDYNIIVADANGCSTTSSASLLSPGAVLADFTFGPQPATTQTPEITFESTSINADSEQWYTVIQGDTIRVYESSTTINFPESEPGNYEVCLVASNTNLCVDTICETVIIDDVFFIFVPNAFSPNNDGVNDIFYPVVNNYEEDSFELLIFDRWGELIFESDSPSTGWKGNHLSNPVKVDTYVWKINTVSKTDGVPKSYTGHVSLIR